MSLSKESQNNVVDRVVHPLARSHPGTARKALYINPFCIEKIEGLSGSEALALLDELCDSGDASEVSIPPQLAAG